MRDRRRHGRARMWRWRRTRCRRGRARGTRCTMWRRIGMFVKKQEREDYSAAWSAARFSHTGKRKIQWLKKKWWPRRRSRNSSATACTASSRMRLFFFPRIVRTISLLNLTYTRFPGSRHSFANVFFASSLYRSRRRMELTLRSQCVMMFSFSSFMSLSER